MRICFVAYDGADCWNGPNVNLRRLLPLLQSKGHEMSCLIIHRGASPLGKYLQEYGVQVRQTFWRGYTERHINWLLEQCGDLRPEIFVPNSSVPAFFTARSLRENGVPTIGVLRAHDGFHRAMLEQFGANDEWRLSGLVCVDHALQRQARDFNSDLPTKVIPSGVPIPPQIASQKGPLRIAYVGRLQQEQKRILDVTRGLCDVLKAQNDASATLFGSGPQQREIEQIIAQNSLQNRLKVAGSVAPEELHGKLIELNTLLLMSDYEGTPGAVMDGMACGLVPVCLDIEGGVRDLVRPNETGILLQRRDELVWMMQTLRADEAWRARLAQNARALIESEFSLDVCANRWEEFCAELLTQVPQETSANSNWNEWKLPEVHPEMAREDERLPTLQVKMWRADAVRNARRVAGKAKRALRRG